ncbi:MAG: hypothetical protein ACR2P5_08535 [Gammaproteobacteria bacterium]
MAIHEQTLNEKIAEILDGMRRDWRVDGEETGVLRDGGGKRPDIVVWQESRPPVLIENEFTPGRGVEEEAAGRIGLKMKDGGAIVQTVIALRSPAKLKILDSRKLKRAAGAAEFDYALLTGKSSGDVVRFPESGWLSGNLSDVADFIYRASIPAELLDTMATSLLHGVNDAAAKIRESDSAVGAKIQGILQQQDGEQTRRMAMLIILNALAFQEMFAGYANIKNISETRADGVDKQKFLDEWEKVLKINYWPIFNLARQILMVLPEVAAREVIYRLHDTVAEIIESFCSHDLFGRVFQRLIADRKFLATFYTRPASAALLANLAVPQTAPFDGGSWKKDAGKYITADFACGTGALLSAVYHRVSELHEKEGGNMRETHKQMMENALVGCDVMPAAVHLTASILAARNPKKLFGSTRLYTMPYGEPKKGEFRIGSLELLDRLAFLPVISTSAEKAAGKQKVRAQTEEVLWTSPHLVIMNPPYTRPTKSVKGIVNPAFAAFGANTKLQEKLGERSKKLREDTCASGNAGLASDFVALANKRVCQDGVVALVLPLSAMAGESWQKIRAMWARDYAEICVISLALPSSEECSFSADTGMAEILFIGKKINGRSGAARKKPRGVFISLIKRPESEIEAVEFSRAIKRVMHGKINKLEDGLEGGSPVFAGKTKIGEIMDAPLSRAAVEPWSITRIRDLTLAQVAYNLVCGRLLLPRWTRKQALDFPVSEFGKFAGRGFIGRDINGVYQGAPRGPFDIEMIADNWRASTYPCLWAHDAQRETRLVVVPDSEGRIRRGMEERAREVWEKASRIHHNSDFRFNSQPLAVAATEKPTIGGIAWPNLIFKNSGQECAYALWGNSTLGLLLYWWWANKQQGGRGRISPAHLPTMPVLDLTALSSAQLAAARRGFNAIKTKEFLPFYRINEDSARAELDKIILMDVLGLPKTTLDGVKTLREKLSREPSIRGGKE